MAPSGLSWAGIKVEAVEISSVEAATVWRRRLLQDAVHVAVEVSSTDDGGNGNPCTSIRYPHDISH